MNNGISAAQRDALEAAFRDGASLAQSRDAAGVSQPTLLKYFARFRAAGIPRGTMREQSLERMRGELEHAWREGLGVRAAARFAGVCTLTVRRYFQSFRDEMVPRPAGALTMRVNRKPDVVVAPPPVPQQVIADRDRRAALAPRSLIAALAGDPLPGYSALERRSDHFR